MIGARLDQVVGINLVCSLREGVALSCSWPSHERPILFRSSTWSDLPKVACAHNTGSVCRSGYLRVESLTFLNYLYYGYSVEFHRSAARHGVPPGEVLHAVKHALVVVDMDPDADPPKVLVIGPRHDGQLLEVIILALVGDRELVIHAMALRPTFYSLLPEGDL